MLHARQLIPPLTVREAHGRLIHAWDYKQKRNLVIAFLDANCPSCESFICNLSDHAAALRETEALALLVFPHEPRSTRCNPLPDGIIAGSDANGRGIPAFLGEDALSSKGLARRAVLVTDRYGEIARMWIGERHEFPAIEEVLSALNMVEIACEECSVPIWPADE